MLSALIVWGIGCLLVCPCFKCLVLGSKEVAANKVNPFA